MMSRSLVLVLCLCAAACSDDASTADTGLADSVSLPDAGSTDAQPLTRGRCETADWPDGYPPAPADLKCSTVAAPWDHAAPGGKTISLRIARQVAKSGTGKALFYFAGGPGGTAVGSSGAIPSLLPGIEQQFDLVYVDQRGTGGSGRMECKAGYPQTAQEWIACGKDHAGTDLSHHLTTDAAHDVDWVRRRLGYDKIHGIIPLPTSIVSPELERRMPSLLEQREVVRASELAGWVDQLLRRSPRPTPLHLIHNTRRMLAVKQHLDRLHHAPINLEELARQHNMDRYYLARGFRQNFGVTPREYLQFLRMEHFAWSLLQPRAAALTRLSSDAGFGDYSTFCRRVQRAFGKAPSDLISLRHA